MDVNRQLRFVFDTIKIKERETFSGRKLFAIEVAEADQPLLARMMNAYQFDLVTPKSEIASFGVMEFEARDGANHERGQEMGAADSAIGNENDDARRGVGRVRRDPSLGGNGRKLRIIVGADDLKFADKIFNGMLQNDDNKAGYAAFLYDFDDFLFMYKNDQADAEDTQDELDGDDFQGGIEKASHTDQDVGFRFLIEIASEVLPFAREEAKRKKKEKSGRSAFLSKLMTILSSGAGETLISAWEKNDNNALAAAMGTLKDRLAETMPKQEKANEEDADESSSDKSDSADVEGEGDDPVEQDASVEADASSEEEESDDNDVGIKDDGESEDGVETQKPSETDTDKQPSDDEKMKDKKDKPKAGEAKSTQQRPSTESTSLEEHMGDIK